MKTKILLKKLARYFPKSLAESYDHVGLQCGKIKEETNTILLCLDYDEEVYQYIIDNHLENKIDMIISHHPFIFGTRAKVLKKDPLKKVLFEKTLTLNIPVYSYHTNFDGGKEGMNDALTRELGLINIVKLESEPMARGGELIEAMEIHDFAKYAMKKLNVNYGLLINEGKTIIKKVAIIGGGGWSSYLNAKDEGYDIFVSGDIPHHGRRGVVANKYNYLDLPHEIEKIFMKQFKKVLLSINPELQILTIDQEDLPEFLCIWSNWR